MDSWHWINGRPSTNWQQCYVQRRDYHFGNSSFIIDLILPLHRRCLWKNFTDDSGGIRTHDLLLTSADVLTSRPPSLPDDDRPARILYSSGFRDIYRLMKFLRRLINNWFNFPHFQDARHTIRHRAVYATLEVPCAVYATLENVYVILDLTMKYHTQLIPCTCVHHKMLHIEKFKEILYFIKEYTTRWHPMKCRKLPVTISWLRLLSAQNSHSLKADNSVLRIVVVRMHNEVIIAYTASTTILQCHEIET